MFPVTGIVRSPTPLETFFLRNILAINLYCLVKIRQYSLLNLLMVLCVELFFYYLVHKCSVLALNYLVHILFSNGYGCSLDGVEFKLCVLIDVHPRHIQPNLDVTHWICFFFFYIVTPCRSTFINIGMLASTRRLVLLDMGNLVCFVGVHGSLWGIFLSLLFRQITQIYIYQFLS